MAIDCLFVYGTLCQAFGHPLQASLQRYGSYLEEASTPGRLLDMGDYPALVVESAGEHCYDPALRPLRESASTDTVSAGGPATDLPLVYGEVYTLYQPGPLLLELDAYEECGPGFAEPTEYVRREITIDLQSGPDLRAWAYVYNWPLKDPRWIDGGDYVAYMRDRGLLQEVE